MKRCFKIFGLALFCLFHYAAKAQNLLWAKQFGGAGNDDVSSLALDAGENVYSTGYFFSTADFDPGAGTYNLTSVGGWDIFVSKLDASGNFLWAKRIGSASTENATGITADHNGNIYVTGYFPGTLDFDPGPGIYNLTAAGSYDIFIFKLDSSGNFVWAKRMGGVADDEGVSIALDGVGNIYTTGSFQSTVDFNPGSGTYNLTAPNGYDDIFVSKLDTSGNFVWARRMGGNRNDRSSLITVDGTGNVYTTGTFLDTVDFDPGSGVFNLITHGFLEDIFVSKLSAAGTFIWAKHMGGVNMDFGRSITVDNNGNVYTTGDFNGTADFDPGTGTYNLVSTPNSIFVSKLDVSGNFVWAKQMSGTGIAIGHSIACDSAGNVYATGNFNYTIDFDPGIGTYNLTANANTYSDIFILKLSASGNLIWVNQMGGPAYDYGITINVSAGGSIYISGNFNATADFDPGPGVFNMTSAGADDIYITKLTDGPTVINEIQNEESIIDIVFPNPSPGIFSIWIKSETKNQHVEIFNELGKKIISQTVSNKIAKIDLSKHPFGIYFVSVRDEKNNVVMKKVVKM